MNLFRTLGFIYDEPCRRNSNYVPLFSVKFNIIMLIKLTEMNLNIIMLIQVTEKKVKVKSLSHVRLCNCVDCSPPGSSVHGILQPRILEWVAFPFSRGSSRTGTSTLVSCIAGRFFTIWATGDCHFESRILWIHLTASLIGGFVTLVTGVDWSTNQEILILVLSMWPWASHISSPSMFLKLPQGPFSVCGWRVYHNIS